MRSPLPPSLALTAVVVLLGVLATATLARVDAQPSDAARCTLSDGLPDHSTDTFPEVGNSISTTAQAISTCPRKTTKHGAKSATFAHNGGCRKRCVDPTRHGLFL